MSTFPSKSKAKAETQSSCRSVWTADHVALPAQRETPYPYPESSTELAFSPGMDWLDPVAVMGFVAVGYLAGFATQCLVLWFALRRCGFSYRWNCNCRDPRLKDTVRLVLYPLAGQMLGECRTLVENFFASFYAPGVLISESLYVLCLKA